MRGRNPAIVEESAVIRKSSYRASREDLFRDDEKAAFKDAKQAAPLIYDPGNASRDALPSAGNRHAVASIDFHKKDRVSPYEDEMDRRRALDPRSRAVIRLGIAVVVAFFAAIVLPDYLFSANNHDLSLAWFLATARMNFSNLVRYVSGGGAYGGIDFTINRLVIVALAGAALSISGAALQGSLKNQLASPSTLGVMSGAQFGAVMYVLLISAGVLPAMTTTGDTLIQQSGELFLGMSPLEYVSAVFQQGFFSLAGSALVVATVLFISWLAGHGRSSRVAMIVTGQVIASLVTSFIVIVRMYVAEYGTVSQLDAMRSLLSANFEGTFTLASLVVVGIPLVVCIVLVLLWRNQLNLLAFDEEEARSMGISVNRLKVGMVACCTVMTAVVVAFCGPVGYVGFLVPHLARRIVGPDFKYLIPGSGLLGALFLIVVFYLFTCFTVPSGSITMVTSLFGLVAFVIVVIRQRWSGYASW